MPVSELNSPILNNTKLATSNTVAVVFYCTMSPMFHCYFVRERAKPDSCLWLARDPKRNHAGYQQSPPSKNTCSPSNMVRKMWQRLVLNTQANVTLPLKVSRRFAAGTGGQFRSFFCSFLVQDTCKAREAETGNPQRCSPPVLELVSMWDAQESADHRPACWRPDGVTLASQRYLARMLQR